MCMSSDEHILTWLSAYFYLLLNYRAMMALWNEISVTNSRTSVKEH